MKRRPPIRANTADEAIEKMLEQKRISSKINYDVLKDLNIKPGASPSHKMETPKKEPRITGRNRKPAPAPLSLSMPLSSLGKRWVNRILDALDMVYQAFLSGRQTTRNIQVSKESYLASKIWIIT